MYNATIDCYTPIKSNYSSHRYLNIIARIVWIYELYTIMYREREICKANVAKTELDDK